MGAQPGDCSENGVFTLQSHIEQNLTTEESTERIAQHFANISQEFPPLNLALLPQEVKVKIHAQINPLNLPDLDDYDIYKKIKETKKPKSSVPGDVPRSLV